jgi:beta-phosphoglucomutase-like phosphatase (HAD superfamily)
LPELVVFLDDGGVMSDNRRRGAQWQQLVGTFFAPRLGGAATAWAQANHVVATALLNSLAWQSRLAAAPDYPTFERTYLLDWLGDMCLLVGVPCPSPEQCVLLAREAEAWITAQVDAAMPDAVETIRLLHAQGYTLHTASGEPSMHLINYLTGMGVRECFGRLYGPDLIDTFKTSSTYYARLLADASVAPASAVVVDDSPDALAWAADVGAHPVRVGAPASNDGAATCSITSLSDLPALLARIESARTNSAEK